MIPIRSLERSGRARLRRAIREHMNGLRVRARLQHEGSLDSTRLERVIFLDPRRGHYGGDCVERLVVFMRGTGCSWVSQSGGCTFCGFWDATNFGRKLDDAQYVQQIDGVLAELGADIERYPILCVYNDGSLLDETEMGLEAVLTILGRLSALPSTRRIVIEAKLSDLREDVLPRLEAAAGSCELEIAVGFESASADVRDLCVNKGFSNAYFAAQVALLRRHGVSLVPLIIVKPPFLHEAQAIHDVIETLRFLEPLGLSRIDLEMATVEENTLVSDLWAHGLYTPPRLWSVLEIVRRSRALGLTTPLFVSPPNYTVPSLAHTANCPQCTPRVVAAIEEYDRRFDPSSFDALECACREAWAAELVEPTDTQGLQGQVQAIFDRLLELQVLRNTEAGT